MLVKPHEQTPTIVKPFTPSPEYMGMSTLIKRLPLNHSLQEKVLTNLKNKEAGDQGEKYVFDFLQTLQFPMPSYLLHNITFSSFTQIQIDILMVTKFFIILMEVKNIKGKLRFTKNPGQLIRENDDGTFETFTNPEIQLEQYADGLSDFLLTANHPIPIYPVIVFAYNNVRVLQPPEHKPIIISREIPNFIKTIPQPKREFDAIEITNLILQFNTNKQPFPMCHYYSLNPHELLKGVICPNCQQSFMDKQKRTWYCPKCHHRSANAHMQALKDYRMLISNEINIKQCQEFLRLKDRYEAWRILESANTQKIKTGKQVTYVLE